MLIQGKIGSFNLFWKGCLISSFPIDRIKDITTYIEYGNIVILNGLRDPKYKGYTIENHIRAYMSFCNTMLMRKQTGKGIRRSDHRLFLASIMALEKLKIIDSEYDLDSGYFICQRKRPKRIKV